MDTTLKATPDVIKQKFSSIVSNEDIAQLLEINKETLIYYVYRLPKNLQYTQFTIPKRNGENRTINAPHTPDIFETKSSSKTREITGNNRIDV